MFALLLLNLSFWRVWELVNESFILHYVYPFFVHSNLLCPSLYPLKYVTSSSKTIIVKQHTQPIWCSFMHKCLELTIWDSVAHQGLLSLEMTTRLPRSSHWLPGALCVKVETWNFPLIIGMWAGILSCRSFLATHHCHRVLLIFWYNE